jgi:hypothetical protein
MTKAELDKMIDGLAPGLKFYVATSLSNAAAQRAIATRLEEHGHTLTYDWTAHGSVQNEPMSTKRLIAISEIDGVLSADVVVVLLPGGNGTHVELGMAIAAKKMVIVVGKQKRDGYECIFYHSPQVHRIGSAGGGVDWSNCAQWDTIANAIHAVMNSVGPADVSLVG